MMRLGYRIKVFTSTIKYFFQVYLDFMSDIKHLYFESNVISENKFEAGFNV